MAEPKNDNILPMPRKRKGGELSPALRKLLGPRRAMKVSAPVEEEREDSTREAIEELSLESNKAKDEELENAKDQIEEILAPTEDETVEESYEDDDFEEDEDSFEDEEDYEEIEEDAEELSAEVEGGISYIPVGAISFSPYQTREILSDNELQGLAESLKEKGVLQPIVVRQLEEDDGFSYELVAGERRYRAAKKAGLTEIPAIVRELSDQESAEFTVIENAQRENLNPVEEALAFKVLVDEFKLPQREIAKLVGKSRPLVANSLRLLQLEDEILEYLKKGELSAGHAKVLLGVEDEAFQRKLARRVVKNGLSVRALEAIVARAMEEDLEEEYDEEAAERLKASIGRAEKRVGQLLDLELELVKVFYDKEGRKKLQLTFESEAIWRKFMARIRE